MVLPSGDEVSEPIPISLMGGRLLLFDINIVTFLRRYHNICGVLTGSIPQVPQQNVFLGLPVELTPEEAKILIEKKIAYLVDDTAWHKQTSTFQGPERTKYLESLRAEALRSKRAIETSSRKKSEHALAMMTTSRTREAASAGKPSIEQHSLRLEDNIIDSLFDNNPSSIERPSSRAPSRTWSVTPTTSYTIPSSPKPAPQQAVPLVPHSYPLFAYLHSRGYYIMPGLRFGCDYNVYPGDPLRFHSHFLAVGYGWNEDIPMLDLIGGGRLGTAVKKGFLIGGHNPDATHEDRVRTFVIEWGGM